MTADIVDRAVSWWARAAHSPVVPETLRRILQRGRVVDVPNAGRMRLNGYDHTQAFPFVFGVWEPGVERLVRELLAPGDVAIDVGANVGYYTLLMARAVGPRGKVLAFEPSPVTFERLRENVEMNGLDNVELFRLGASDHRGTVGLSGGSIRNQGRSSMVRGDAEHQVEVAPLDEQIPEDLWPRVRLVKIDVEGAEPAVLAGMQAGLRRLPEESLVFLELAGESEGEYQASRAIFDDMRSRGYQPFAIPNRYDVGFYLHPGDLRARLVTELPRGGTTDFVFVRAVAPRPGFLEVDA